MESYRLDLFNEDMTAGQRAICRRRDEIRSLEAQILIIEEQMRRRVARHMQLLTEEE